MSPGKSRIVLLAATIVIVGSVGLWYWAGVQRYLEIGDDSGLRRIRRSTIVDADGKRTQLIKNLTELERLGSAGVLSFESLYSKVA